MAAVLVAEVSSTAESPVATEKQVSAVDPATDVKASAVDPTTDVKASAADPATEELQLLRKTLAEQSRSIARLLEGQRRLEERLSDPDDDGRNLARVTSLNSRQSDASTVGPTGSKMSGGGHQDVVLVVPSRTKVHKEHTVFQRIIDHWAFEYVSGAMVLLHSAVIGAYVEYLAVVDPHQHPVLTIMNKVLVIIFVLEVLLKMCAERGMYFRGPESAWNIYDCVLLVGLLVIEIVMHHSKSHTKAWVKIGEMVRTGRVLRILKCLHLSVTFQVILSKITYSLKSLVWVLLLVFMLLYVVAVSICQGVLHKFEGLHHHEHFAEEQLDDSLRIVFVHFGSVEKSLYTLFQSITGGKPWSHIAEALSEVSPAYAAIFVAFIALTTLAVFNMVTGIFVDAAISSAKHQRDEMTDIEQRIQETQANELRDVFHDLDSDGDGVLDIQEFQDLLHDERVVMFLHSMKISTADVNRLFRMLDQDRSGCILIDEFVNGCMHLQGSARNFDIQRLLAGQARLQRRLDTVVNTGHVQRLPTAMDRTATYAVDFGFMDNKMEL